MQVRHVLFCTLAMLGASAGAATAAPGDIFIQLDDEGFDMVLDPLRERLYVSIPNRNEIVLIDTASGQMVDRIRFDGATLGLPSSDLLVGTKPHGLDMSLDESLLFVALNQASSVVFVDLDTLGLNQVVVGQELGHASTWDVMEGAPNKVFVSANPGSGGFAYIAMIDRAIGNATSRVASNTIIRSRPMFARSPDRASLYVGSGFSPNSLYKLDLSAPDAPIVLEDQHGAVSGTDYMAVSPDGHLIYLSSGQVLQTSDFVQIGLVGRGIPRLSADGTRAFVAMAPGVVEIYETEFFTQVDTVDLPCSLNSIRAFEVLNDGEGFLVLGDDSVCGIGPTLQRFTCQVAPTYDEGTLTLGFTLSTPTPLTWNLWVSAGAQTVVVWSGAIPAVDPAVAFDVPFPGVPPQGTLGLLTTLTNADGIVCSDWKTVDTGLP